MSRIRWILFTAIVVSEVFVAVECHGERTADASAIQVRSFHVGFSGYYKLGYWSPAFVEIDAPEGAVLTLLLTVPDGDGVPTTTRATHTVPPISKLSKTLSKVELLCKVGRPDGVIKLEVYQGKERVAREQYRLGANDYQPLASATQLIVSLGATAKNFRKDCALCCLYLWCTTNLLGIARHLGSGHAEGIPRVPARRR